MNKAKPSLITAALLAIALLFTACNGTVPDGLWETAIYTSDTELGTGSKTLTLEVSAADKVITVTLHTDKETVGNALLDAGLIEGTAGQFGLYVDSVNGITVNYKLNSSYWAFYENGNYAAYGVDSTAIVEGTVYRLEYTIYSLT